MSHEIVPTYLSLCVYGYVHEYAYVHEYIHVYGYICIGTVVCMNICIISVFALNKYMCIYKCLWMCAFICIYIHKHEYIYK